MTNLNHDHLEILKNFKNKLDTDGLISQGAVLSFEELLGANILTGVNDIKTFSNRASVIGVQESKEILDSYITTIELANVFSFGDMLDVEKRLTETIFNIIHKVEKFAASVKSEAIDHMLCDELAYYYREVENFDGKMIESRWDIREDNIVDILTKRYNYLEKVASFIGGDVDARLSKLKSNLDGLTDETFPIISLLVNTNKESFDLTKPSLFPPLISISLNYIKDIYRNSSTIAPYLRDILYNVRDNVKSIGTGEVTDKDTINAMSKHISQLDIYFANSKNDIVLLNALSEFLGSEN